jgi:hypothetical protein
VRKAQPRGAGELQSGAYQHRHSVPVVRYEEPRTAGSAKEICETFTQRFYFGCEGDDPLNALASDTKGSPFGAKLHALYGSDLGHWDVPDMAQAAEEAHELVERGVISADAFRDMVFTNAVEFWTSGNRDFFSGTRCTRPWIHYWQTAAGNRGSLLRTWHGGLRFLFSRRSKSVLPADCRSLREFTLSSPRLHAAPS